MNTEKQKFVRSSNREWRKYLLIGSAAAFFGGGVIGVVGLKCALSIAAIIGVAHACKII
jgi:hypothetical protein